MRRVLEEEVIRQLNNHELAYARIVRSIDVQLAELSPSVVFPPPYFKLMCRTANGIMASAIRLQAKLERIREFYNQYI